MPDSIKASLTENLQKAKVASGTRVVRVGKIFQEAAIQTVSELKAGKTEISEIAQDTFTTVSATLKSPTTDAESKDTATAPGAASESGFTRVWQSLKQRLVKLWQQRSLIFQDSVAQWEKQRQTVDTKLTEQYGDRYVQTKQQVNRAVTAYNQALANQETPISDVLHQKQSEFETNLSEAGSKVAKAEQQVRQNLKTLLQTTAEKL